MVCWDRDFGGDGRGLFFFFKLSKLENISKNE